MDELSKKSLAAFRKYRSARRLTMAARAHVGADGVAARTAGEAMHAAADKHNDVSRDQYPDEDSYRQAWDEGYAFHRSASARYRTLSEAYNSSFMEYQRLADAAENAYDEFLDREEERLAAATPGRPISDALTAIASYVDMVGAK